MPERRGLTREIVVTTAAALIDKAGSPDAITLADLAAHFHVKVPSLYNHVNGIADLREAVALQTYQQFNVTLRDAVIGKSADEALMATAMAARRFAHEHPGLYPLLVRPVNEALSGPGQRIIDILMAIMAAYNLSDSDALHAIRGLRSIMHGFVDIERSGGFGLPLDLDESYRRLVTVFIQGLRRTEIVGSIGKTEQRGERRKSRMKRES
jgi:AcrR family transcriptional regulator